MKRHWDLEELIEQWTLLPHEMKWLGTKTGEKRLGFAICLKFFQSEGQFPENHRAVASTVVHHIAKQVEVEPKRFRDYKLNHRAAKYHRQQIRELCGYRRPTMADAQALRQWLIDEVLPQTLDKKQLQETTLEWFRKTGIEPLTPGRTQRIIHSAIREYETQMSNQTLAQLTPKVLKALEQLLKPVDQKTVAQTEPEPEPESEITRFAFLKQEPGAIGIKTLLQEVKKLQDLREIGLPDKLFEQMSSKNCQTYRTRAATESIWELRRHPCAIRYTLVAAFCWKRQQEVSDYLIDLLNQMVQRLNRRAERKVAEEVFCDFRQVSDHHQILYRIACVALANPTGTIQDCIYPVASPELLQGIVQESQTKGVDHNQRVHKVLRNFYKYHYRRMIAPIIKTLEFRSNNEAYQPIIHALELLKKYVDSQQPHYELDELIPLQGILSSRQSDGLSSRDEQENLRIDRINYEIAVLQALRDGLRSRSIWAVGADRYRNPEADLPADFEMMRFDYYQALKQPADVEEFIESIQREMKQTLADFNDHLPDNPKVKLLTQRSGWIRLSPLPKQPEPQNLLNLKSELTQRWPMTSLLDILKEG